VVVQEGTFVLVVRKPVVILATNFIDGLGAGVAGALAESTGLPSADSSAAAVAVALLEKYQRVRWVEKTFSLTWEKGEKAEGDGFSIREERKTVAKLEGSSLQNALQAASRRCCCCWRWWFT
jgi:hypothetical protein